MNIVAIIICAALVIVIISLVMEVALQSPGLFL